ncbi:MAG: cytochrome C biogenesis protein [Actinobacteria bacterium 69-20]|nr:cytochrome c biogenesis protein CcdA [Actinomycetota bacterium]OJV28082.1 MAG: cytochrome C biogenesis protein [Actinobacteria bacterium 69-20]
MGGVLIGTTLLTSFLGGVVALLAPCCVSVMLPAYLSTGFRHRGGLLAATLVFGAGVATLILPIGLGATAISTLLFSGHVWVFSIAGLLMLAGGVAILAGWKPNLPMPAARAAKQGSFSSAYSLGLISGAASACCAPVLAGVALLSGAAASFPVSLAIGGSYVAGMVAPLALAGLFWQRRRDRSTRILSDRPIRLRIGRWQRRISLGTAVSGLLMIAMAVLTEVVAFTGPGMSSGGWQTRLSAWLQHVAAQVERALAWVPGWAVLIVIVAGFGLLIGAALRRYRPAATETHSIQAHADQPALDDQATLEEMHGE